MKGTVSVCCDGGRGAGVHRGTASPLRTHGRGLDGVGARKSDADGTTTTTEVTTTTRPRHARGSGETRAGNHDDNYDEVTTTTRRVRGGTAGKNARKDLAATGKNNRR
jgi:hypothetical protein